MHSVSLAMTQSQHQTLREHLFPGDGLEAVALLVCGRRNGDRHRLLVNKVAPVPYDACSVREPDRVTWSTNLLPSLLADAAASDSAIVKIHGHTGFDRFSSTDDEADRVLFPSIFAWNGGDAPHGSAIMMHDGRVFGRAWMPDGTFTPFESVSCVGDDIQKWRAPAQSTGIPEHARRIAQSFGEGTFEHLKQLKAGVVGCSGTGSPVVEMLARNCVGSLVIVDPDVIEEKNLNRILNSTKEDAKYGRAKVDVASRAIQRMGLGSKVQTFQRTLFNREVVAALADCDVLFGCMDSIDGRHLLNRIATFYCIPYFDLGVKLEADGRGGIDQVCGTVNYLKPGGSSLFSRNVYTLQQLAASGLARTDPGTYRRQVAEGYLRGVLEDRPAVIQLNTLIASLAVNELLARLHPYRIDSNASYAIHRVSLSHGIYEHEYDGAACPMFAKYVGRGDVEPLLNWPELSIIE